MNRSRKLVEAIRLRMGGKYLLQIPKIHLVPVLAMIITLSGCATIPSAEQSVVRQGDQADVQFTCRLKNGEVAISTYREVAEDPSVVKSVIFMGRDKDTPVKLTAGGEQSTTGETEERGFLGEVVHQLSNSIIGLHVHEKNTVEVKAEPLPERQKGEHLLKMARVRQRPKEVRISLDEYKTETGSEAEVGRTFVFDSGLSGTVEAVDDKEALVRFFAAPGATTVTPLGKGVIREMPDHFDIVIDAHTGDLVQSEGLVGRVVDVNENEITIDYRHPFGGESLLCDVLVESVSPPLSQPGPVQSAMTQVAPKAAPEEQGMNQEKVPTTERVVQDSPGQARKAETVEKKEKANLRSSKSDNAERLAVRKGDLVEVNYTAALEDGSLIYTTLSDVVGETGRKKALGFEQPRTFAPEELVAGGSAKIPGVAQSVIGMVMGEKKKMVIPPESAYGRPDPGNLLTLPAVKTYPKTIEMTPGEYFGQFNVSPVQGSEAQFTPYFKARVEEVTETSTVVSLMARDGDQFKEDYGSVTVHVEENQVVVALAPRIGASFKTEAGDGVITGTDGKNFTVDLNSPLAGKSIVLDIEVVALTPTSALGEIPWAEDHDKGLASAKSEGKPAVMVLYADWCAWCHKLLTESFPDPRVKALRDRLVWIKVNSDKNRQYYEKYGQNSFPMIVFFGPDGRITQKIDGYVEADVLRAALRALIDAGKAVRS